MPLLAVCTKCNKTKRYIAKETDKICARCKLNSKTDTKSSEDVKGWSDPEKN